MGKYLKIIKSECVNGYHNNKQTNLINSCKFRAQAGPTVYCLSNEEKSFTRALFVPEIENTSANAPYIDDITQFTWETGITNGYACVYITFQAINEKLKGNISPEVVLCIETDTSVSRPNSLGVFNTSSNLKTENEGKTYLKMNDVEIGKTYMLYIGSLPNKGVWRKMKKNLRHGKGTNNEETYEIRLNIRPTMRLASGRNIEYKKITNLPEYRFIKYQHKYQWYSA